jgi:hypothetical protein
MHTFIADAASLRRPLHRGSQSDLADSLGRWTASCNLNADQQLARDLPPQTPPKYARRCWTEARGNSEGQRTGADYDFQFIDAGQQRCMFALSRRRGDFFFY